jgi:hypothetical protein
LSSLSAAIPVSGLVHRIVQVVLVVADVLVVVVLVAADRVYLADLGSML